ncbi:hypothetical protein BJX70DRAFT_389952 [Aspergillus crustosus]
MDGPPPPPPPHGEKPNTTHGEYRKSSDLPQGNYDIFVIPPHSAGSGFLYLPSLQCQRNSFIAGSACTLVAVYLWMTLAPVVRLWYATTLASGGGAGIAILAVGVVGVGGWAFGNYQAGSGGSSRQGRSGPGFGPNWFGSGASGANNPGGGENYSRGGSFGGQGGGSHQQGNYGGNFAGGPPPGNQYSGNQYRANNDPPPQSTPGPNPKSKPDPGPPPGPNPEAKSRGGASAKPTDTGPQSDKNPHTADDWEKAREETRRKEELRRKMEEFKRKREAEAREKERQREREKMEKELRERREQLEREMAAAREAAAREARLQAEKEAAEHRARLEREAAEARLEAEKAAAEARQKDLEARARIEREAAEARAKAERLEAEARARAEKEAAEKEAAAKAAAKKEADAKFAALKEAAAKKYAEKKARDAQEAAAAKEAAATASKVSSASAPPPRTPSPKKPSVPPSKASAPAADDDAYSFRPYDRPRRPYGGTSVYSESSYAPSQSTARTTPPPSHRGPYETKDPDKIVIRGVYAFNQALLRTPVAQLVSGQGMVTDGLVLRITTEGLFIDDDIRGVPQREWDVKAWTMKLVEVWCHQVGPPKANGQKANQTFFRRSTSDAPTAEESDAYLANFLKVCKNTCRLATPAFSRNSTDSKESQPHDGLHVLRATIRDQEGRRGSLRYVLRSNLTSNARRN